MVWPTRGNGDGLGPPADKAGRSGRPGRAARPGRDGDQMAVLDETSAVLDVAHVGDIQGAFGTIKQHDTGARRSWSGKLLTLLAIMGPGLIVMVGDNDAGGVSTYAQAGQNYGLSLLWTLPLLVPVLIVNQEMVVRLGAVTGVGHARLINERFGRFWGWFSVGDLFILNFLTIATEFIGVSLALDYFGVSHYISVPIAATLLVVMTATGSFRRWERFMFVFVAANFLVIPLAVFSHPSPGSFFHGLAVPGVTGGFNSTSILLVIAIVGTTVAPWQLFFQQSNIVDKRITPRWINYERTDTVIGSIVTVIAASLIVAVCATAFAHRKAFGNFTDAKGVAIDLSRYVGHGAGTMFAIILLNASIIGAAAVTLSTSYAFGDVFGARHSLHRGWREAKLFYGTFSAMVALAAGLVLIPPRSVRAHHNGCPGPCRRALAQRHRLSSASLQRQGRARTLGERADPERRCGRHRVDPSHAVAHSHDLDGISARGHKEVGRRSRGSPAARISAGGLRAPPTTTTATTGVGCRYHSACGSARDVAHAAAQPSRTP